MLRAVAFLHPRPGELDLIETPGGIIGPGPELLDERVVVAWRMMHAAHNGMILRPRPAPALPVEAGSASGIRTLCQIY